MLQYETDKNNIAVDFVLTQHCIVFSWQFVHVLYLVLYSICLTLNNIHSCLQFLIYFASISFCLCPLIAFVLVDSWIQGQRSERPPDPDQHGSRSGLLWRDVPWPDPGDSVHGPTQPSPAETAEKQVQHGQVPELSLPWLQHRHLQVTTLTSISLSASLSISISIITRTCICTFNKWWFFSVSNCMIWYM